MTAQSGWPPEIQRQDVVEQGEQFVRSLETRFSIYIRTMRRLVDVTIEEKGIVGELQGALLRGFNGLKPEAAAEIIAIVGRWTDLADRQADIVKEGVESLKAEDERVEDWKKNRRTIPPEERIA